MIAYIIFILIIVIGLWALMFQGRRSLHIMQLEGYKNERYRLWLSQNKSKAFRIKPVKVEVKKELVMTDRAKRLQSMLMGINAVLVALAITIYIVLQKGALNYGWLAVFTLVLFGVIYLFQPCIIILANALMKPVEKNINDGFYRAAQKKIASFSHVKVVGITGSYGKTSTKFITTSILQSKFLTRTTPSSYNTPMGISKVINEDLTALDEIFVVEMGARHEKDIEELAKLAKPTIGVITSVGPAHLETFGSIETVMKTKYELIEELPKDGVAVFNYDNPYVRKLADRTFKKKWLYGIEKTDKVDIFAKNIQVYELGTTFVLCDKEGHEVATETKLLGKHNIENILAGACVARELGMSMEEIAAAIPHIEPVEHRLNIINPGTGIIIIDDAFNSNPAGAKAALETLSQFKSGNRIIVTPGMVELGDREYEENLQFGREIAKVCEYAILVGEKRTTPIREGLKKENYPEDRVIIVNQLTAASEWIAKHAKPGDIILFENDLPDTYNEA